MAFGTRRGCSPRAPIKSGKQRGSGPGRRDSEDLAWIDQVRIVNLSAIGHIDDGVVSASSIRAVRDPPQAVAWLDDNPPVVQGNVGGSCTLERRLGPVGH